jgi:hypothetical protein
MDLYKNPTISPTGVGRLGGQVGPDDEVGWDRDELGAIR